MDICIKIEPMTDSVTLGYTKVKVTSFSKKCLKIFVFRLISECAKYIYKGSALWCLVPWNCIFRIRQDLAKNLFYLGQESTLSDVTRLAARCARTECS